MVFGSGKCYIFLFYGINLFSWKVNMAFEPSIYKLLFKTLTHKEEY